MSREIKQARINEPQKGLMLYWKGKIDERHHLYDSRHVGRWVVLG